MYIDKSTSGSDCADILRSYPNTRGKDGMYNTIYDSDKMKAFISFFHSLYLFVFLKNYIATPINIFVYKTFIYLYINIF